MHEYEVKVLNFTVIPDHLILNLYPFTMNTFCPGSSAFLKIIFGKPELLSVEL